jgi:hypothetical protein
MEKRLLQEMRFMMERLESPRMTDTELTKKRNKLNESDGSELFTVGDYFDHRKYMDDAKICMNYHWRYNPHSGIILGFNTYNDGMVSMGKTSDGKVRQNDITNVSLKQILMSCKDGVEIRFDDNKVMKNLEILRNANPGRQIELKGQNLNFGPLGIQDIDFLPVINK